MLGKIFGKILKRPHATLEGRLLYARGATILTTAFTLAVGAYVASGYQNNKYREAASTRDMTVSSWVQKLKEHPEYTQRSPEELTKIFNDRIDEAKMKEQLTLALLILTSWTFSAYQWKSYKKMKQNVESLWNGQQGPE